MPEKILSAASLINELGKSVGQINIRSADAYADQVIPDSRAELAVQERKMRRSSGPEAAAALHTAYDAWKKGDKAGARAAVATMLLEGAKFANLHPIDSVGGSIQNGLESLGYTKADPARCK